MYCPSCGNQQSEEKKFCTACGTNLALVSNALSYANSSPNPVLLSEAIVKYNQQFSTAITNASTGIGLIIAAIFLYLTMRFSYIPWISMGLIIGGFSSLGKGVAQFYFASQERKASQLQSAQTTTIPLPATPTLEINSTTTPLPPQSITDHTTRHLG